MSLLSLLLLIVLVLIVNLTYVLCEDRYIIDESISKGIELESSISKPTLLPTRPPVTSKPTNNPTTKPSFHPTTNPTIWPTRPPVTSAPTRTAWPTKNPNFFDKPSTSFKPTFNPTIIPTKEPSFNPSTNPTLAPTISPTLFPTEWPTQFPTTNPTSNPTSNSYTQYDDRLRINFDVTLRTSTIYGDYYCIDIPTAYAFSDTSYQASIYDTTSSNWISDLEIYFEPTSEYIGTNNANLAVTQIAGWPGAFSKSTTTPVDSGIQSISLSSGFNQVCFANNCNGGCSSSTNYINEFVGYIDLYGIVATTSSPITASYTQYDDRLRINFDVTLRTSTIYGDYYCTSIPSTYLIGSTFYEVSIYDTSSTNPISDLEIYFPVTSQYIGTDEAGFASIQLTDWPSILSTSSTTAVDSSLQSITLTPGFNEVCFANNCDGDCSSSTTFINEFVGYIDLYGISTTTSSISTASYIQYDDKLRINFDVTLRTSTIYGDYYCIDIPTAYAISDTSYQASIYDTSSNWISDLEIYFEPTSESIGGDYAGFATYSLVGWPFEFSTSSSTLRYGDVLPVSLSSGFNQVCFANNCHGGCSSSTNYINEFVGYIDLFGISINE